MLFAKRTVARFRLKEDSQNGSPYALETMFLWISVSFGLAYLLITPPFQGADESRHYARAYQLAEVALSTLGLTDALSLSPKSLVQAIDQTTHLRAKSARSSFVEIWSLMQVDLRPSERAFFPETANYLFVSYIPQILLIAPLRLAQVNAVITLYMARLASLFFWVWVTYWALRLLPIGRPMFFFIALLPMTVFQAGSVSADGMTFALSFLLTSFCLRLIHAPVRLTHLLLLAGLSVTLTAAKVIYLPMIGLFFLLPRRAFRSPLLYWGSFVAMGVVCLAILLYWTAPVAVTVTSSAPSVAAGVGLTPYPQLNFLLENPLNIPRMLVATGARFGRSYLNGFVGLLGWYGAGLPSYLYIVAFILLWLTALTSRDRFILSLPQKGLLAGIVVLVTALICAGISTDGRENPIPTFEMRGIQGRYFTPVALLISLLAANRLPFFARYRELVNQILTPFVLFLHLNACYFLLERYYL